MSLTRHDRRFIGQSRPILFCHIYLGRNICHDSCAGCMKWLVWVWVLDHTYWTFLRYAKFFIVQTYFMHFCCHVAYSILSLKLPRCWSYYSVSQIKYRERAIGLILVSPICRKPSWSEWLYNKVDFAVARILSRYFADGIRFHKLQTCLELSQN